MVISVSLGAQSYPILLEAGALARAGQHLSLARRVLVVTDSGVPQEYARTVAGACRQARICTLPAGENSKNMDNYQRLLREMLALGMDRGDCVAAVGGIMNGTCNYILDNMTRQGLNYDDVLKQAQALGYAEADPSTDVDGIDTWHKVILSANIAFGVSLDKETVPVAGIRNIKAEDVENFKAHGLVCKLISTGKRENGVISAYVQPTLVKDGEPEAAVPMNYNLITFVGETSQRMSFFGQGAGRYPTAYNVVQDLVDVLAGKGFYAPYGGHAAAVNDEKLTWYVRGNWNGETKEHWGSAAVTAPVSVAAMHAWLKENPNAFAAAIRG